MNKSVQKVAMPEQQPNIRNKNFKEVALGYNEGMAQEEAQRCIECKNRPCVKGCPVNVQIPEFISLIKKGEFYSAYKKITETNALPAVCGRVCPQERQCEQYCVRGKNGEPVAIGRLERFAADWFMQNETPNKDELSDSKSTSDKKVAVIGAGPASLTCAGDLAKLGYRVTVFEAFHKPGGVLVYGIPEFRLPKSIVATEINKLESMGVEIRTNMVIGRSYTIDELMQEEGYEAVFIGTGAGLPKFMGLEGENLNGVYSANEFLTRINLMNAYEWPNTDTPVRIGKSVAVVGGGNVAMDAARSAMRLGADKVYIIYRRSQEEMPARQEEIHHAKEEGIDFRLLTNPTRLIGNDGGWVTGMECVQMELGEPDATGRRKPSVKKDSEHIIEVQTVIIAIGTSPNPLIKNTTKGLDTQAWGGINADAQTGLTSREGVYAGGDAVTGAATVILAMGAGKKAAVAIDEYLKNKKN